MASGQGEGSTTVLLELPEGLTAAPTPTPAPTITPKCFTIQVFSEFPGYAWYDAAVVISQPTGQDVPGFNALSGLEYAGADVAEETEWCSPAMGAATIGIAQDYYGGSLWTLLDSDGVTIASGAGISSETFLLSGTSFPTPSPTTSPTASPTTSAPTMAPTTSAPTFAPTSTAAPTATAASFTLTMSALDSWSDFIGLEFTHDGNHRLKKEYTCQDGSGDCVETLALQNIGCFTLSIVAYEANISPTCFTLRLSSTYPGYAWDTSITIEAVDEESIPGFTALGSTSYSGSGSPEDIEYCTPQLGSVNVVVAYDSYGEAIWTLLDPGGNEIGSGQGTGSTTVEFPPLEGSICKYDATTSDCIAEARLASYTLTPAGSSTLVATGDGTGSTSTFCLPFDDSTAATFAPTASPIEDCNGVRVSKCYPMDPDYNGDCSLLLGDGRCDDTENNPSEAVYNFNCIAYQFDGGDCVNTMTIEDCVVDSLETNPSSKVCCAAVNDLDTALDGGATIASALNSVDSSVKSMICDFDVADGCFNSVAFPFATSLGDASVAALKTECSFESAAPTFSPTPSPTKGCEFGYIPNCVGGCTEDTWPGDQYCDQELNCWELNYDEGDCKSSMSTTFTDCDGNTYNDYDCLVSSDIDGVSCAAVTAMKTNGRCDKLLLCEEYDYDNDECPPEPCELSGLDLGNVSPLCCDALEVAGASALSADFSLASYVADGWCGKQCGHPSVVGFNILDLLGGTDYKDDFIDICINSYGINLKGGLSESGSGDAYTETFTFDLDNGFSLPDGVAWPVNKTFSKDVSLIVAAFEVPISAPWNVVNDIVGPLSTPLDYAASILTKVSEASTAMGSSLPESFLRKSLFIDFSETPTPQDSSRRLEDAQCTVLFQDIGVVADTCCTKITTAASALLGASNASEAILEYADSETCVGSCYTAIAQALQALEDSGLIEDASVFNPACEDLGFTPGTIPTPNPTPSPTTEEATAAPTTAESTVYARVLVTFAYEYGHFNTEGGSETHANEVADTMSLLQRTASDNENWGEVTKIENFNKIVTLDMKTEGHNPTPDEMDCLFMGAFSLGRTSHDCCLIINTLAPLFLGRGFDDTEFDTTHLFANQLTCTSCVDVMLSTLKALEAFPFNKKNVLQPFVDSCYEILPGDIKSEYAFSTMAPTPVPVCMVADRGIGQASSSCCAYLRSSVTDLAIDVLSITDFVDNERDMLCSFEDTSCAAAAKNMFSIDTTGGDQRSADFDTLCSGGTIITTENCKIKAPNGDMVTVGSTKVECCNHLIDMARKIDIFQGAIGENLTPQYADLTTCTGDCNTTISQALFLAETWYGVPNLLAPFQQECSGVQSCSYGNEALGYTTNACCNDIKQAGNSVLAGSTEVIASKGRCDERWGCRNIFTLGLGYAEDELGYKNVLNPFLDSCSQYDYTFEVIGYEEDGSGSGGSGSGGEPSRDDPTDLTGYVALPAYSDLFQTFCDDRLSCFSQTMQVESSCNLEYYKDLLGAQSGLEASDYGDVVASLLGVQCKKKCGVGLCPTCEIKVTETYMLCTTERFVDLSFQGTLTMAGLVVPDDDAEFQNLVAVLEETIRLTTQEMQGEVKILSIGSVILKTRRAQRSRKLSDQAVVFEVTTPLACLDETCTNAQSQGMVKIKSMESALESSTNAGCTQNCFLDQLKQAVVTVATSKGVEPTEMASSMEDSIKNVQIKSAEVKVDVGDVVEGKPDFNDGSGGGDGFQIIGEAGRLKLGRLSVVSILVVTMLSFLGA